MEDPDVKNKSLIVRAGPLIIYEITFILFVIYYARGGTTWFKISFVLITVSAITVLIKIISSYRQLTGSGEKDQKPISLLADFLFFALYLFSLLVQADQWKTPLLPHLIIIPFLAIPPITAFIEFLYSEARKHSDTPNDSL